MNRINIVFITPQYRRTASDEFLGTLILSDIVRKAGYSFQIVRYCDIEECWNDYDKFRSNLVTRVSALSPDIVSFYCRADNYPHCADLAFEIKQACENTVVIFGGPQASLTAESTLLQLPFVDYVCRGEGETTILPLMDYLLNRSGDPSFASTIRGLAYRCDGTIVQNPLPDLLENDYVINFDYYDLIPEEYWESARENDYHIDVGRGCPFNCIFCSTSTFWNRKFRFRNIKNTVDEIEYVRDHFGIRRFSLLHDLFTCSRGKVLEFCDELERRNLDIHWTCSARIDTVDHELLDVMKQHGMIGVHLSVETASPRLQKVLRKNLKLDACRDIVQYAVDLGLETRVPFIHGIPTETEDDINSSLEMMFEFIDSGVTLVQHHLLAIYNGTELYEMLKDQVYLSDHISDENICWGFRSLYKWISAYPSLFVSYYDYPNPMREEMRFLPIFLYLYKRFPRTFGYINAAAHRHGFRALDVYRSFCGINQEILLKIDDAKKDSEHAVMRAFYVLAAEAFRKAILHNGLFSLSPEECVTVDAISKEDFVWRIR